MEVGGVLDSADLLLQRPISGDQEQRAPAGVSPYHLKCLPSLLAREPDEGVGVQVDRVGAGVQVQILHLQSDDAWYPLLALDAALYFEDSVLAHAFGAFGIDPRKDHNLGEPARVVELEHRHHVTLAGSVAP